MFNSFKLLCAVQIKGVGLSQKSVTFSTAPATRRNMTDLLLSELLVLLLLLPVPVRPFSKTLKKSYAIPILPFLSLFVCICILVGQGITLFLFILLFFTLIVCLSEITRLTAFFQGVLNDFYGIPSIILRIALLILFGGIAYLAFRFAPEADVKTGHPLTVRHAEAAENPANPIEGLLMERAGGADKRALVIVAEALPFSGRPETIASLLADKGYTVLEITRLKPHGFLPRFELYRKLLPLAGKKEKRYLAKEDDPQTAAFFAAFIQKAVARYGRNKRLFLYAEGIYTDLTARFCTENPDIFTGVFFCLSEEEPLSPVPDGWATVVRAEAFETAPESAHTVPAEAENAPERPLAAVTEATASGGESAPAADGKTIAAGEQAAPADTAVTVAMLPFYCYIQPYSELTGFGSLRAEDVLAAELLGSGRSIGRKDKAAAAAAFDRYAILF